MNKPFSNLLLLLAILLVSASLVVPASAVAQDYCYNCKLWTPEQGPEPEEDHFACRATEELGYQACELSEGGRKCNHSNRPDGSFDCLIVLDPAGRVYSAEFPRRMQEAAPAVNVLLEVARHECTGAIIRRRYSPARIAEQRSGLRHVTI